MPTQEDYNKIESFLSRLDEIAAKRSIPETSYLSAKIAVQELRNTLEENEVQQQAN